MSEMDNAVVSDEASAKFTRKMDGGSIESPRYCDHKRGSNWAAKLTGPNAARMERKYLRQRNEIVDLTTVRAGDVLEFGGDYSTASGRREPNRAYWHIIEVDFDNDSISYRKYPTPAKAIRAAREAVRAATTPAMADMMTPVPEAEAQADA